VLDSEVTSALEVLGRVARVVGKVSCLFQARDHCYSSLSIITSWTVHVVATYPTMDHYVNTTSTA
jgi:hypothetical protein